ncbi:MAG: hypothetical protein AVDCRST_MAG11-1954, partial [uncultured Gemmatimonadaceae bacterium]
DRSRSPHRPGRPLQRARADRRAERGARPPVHRGVRRQLQGVRPHRAAAHRVGPRLEAARARVVADAGRAGALPLDPGAGVRGERAAHRGQRADVAGRARRGAAPGRAAEGEARVVGVQAPLRAAAGRTVLPVVRAQSLPAGVRRALHVPGGAAAVRGRARGV